MFRELASISKPILKVCSTAFRRNAARFRLKPILPTSFERPSRIKFSLLSLLAIVAVICFGLSVYEVASQPRLPAMPGVPGCVLGWDGCRVSDPLGRVYIAGPTDSDETCLPNY